MKLIFVAIFLIATVYNVIGIGHIHHTEDDYSSIQNVTYLMKQKCDFRQVTPFEGKTWWFCTREGTYAVMGRFNAYGLYSIGTTLRCYTTEDCMLTEESTDVCVNIENHVRACYHNPFDKPPPGGNLSFNLAVLLLNLVSTLRSVTGIGMAVCALLVRMGKGCALLKKCRKRKMKKVGKKKKEKKDVEKKEEPKDKKE